MATDDTGNVIPFAGLVRLPTDDEPAAPGVVTRTFDRIIEAMVSTQRALNASNGFVDELAAEVRRQRADIAELRAACAALSNRIESTNRVLASRTDHLA